MIKVENLSKSYSEVQAVKAINFELNDGEIVGFLGANGAGKSTTLKVMTGYLTPTSGNVYVNNLDIQHDTHEIQKQIGYLPELNPLYGEMRVYDLLEFTGNIRNIHGKAFKNSLARVIEQCGLQGVIHRIHLDSSKNYIIKQLFSETEIKQIEPIISLEELIPTIQNDETLKSANNSLMQLMKIVENEKTIYKKRYIYW